MAEEKSKILVGSASLSFRLQYLICNFTFSKKIESPFESKPKLHRSNSFNKKKEQEDTNTIFVDYNPQSGVTFRENRNSDVQIVGKGYNDDISSSDSRSTLNGITNNKTKDRRRVTKGKSVFFGF